MKTTFLHWMLAVVFLSIFCPAAFAESQENDYKGITDPFGDPSSYEFAEDEKEDKEFFHLSKFLMLGVDLGLGVFTGGLGSSTDAGFGFGARMVYFFDRHLALETAFHASFHIDSVRPTSGGFVDLDTRLYPITVAMRYYFETRTAPRVIALANPYLVFGGGMYIRSQSVNSISSGFSLPNGSDVSSTAFGGFGGAGVEFPLYRKNFFLGADARYHLIFFDDETDTFNGALPAGSRAGDFFSINGTISYSF